MGKQDDKAGENAGRDKGKKPMPPQAVDAVGRKLKASYDQMLREPIPDKLMQLLDELDRSQSTDARSRTDDTDEPIEPASDATTKSGE